MRSFYTQNDHSYSGTIAHRRRNQQTINLMSLWDFSFLFYVVLRKDFVHLKSLFSHFDIIVAPPKYICFIKVMIGMSTIVICDSYCYFFSTYWLHCASVYVRISSIKLLLMKVGSPWYLWPYLTSKTIIIQLIVTHCLPACDSTPFNRC